MRASRQSTIYTAAWVSPSSPKKPLPMPRHFVPTRPRCMVPLTASPQALLPCLRGWSAHASGSGSKGWGVHDFWPYDRFYLAPIDIRLLSAERLSTFSPLELRTASAAVELLGKTAQIPQHDIIVILRSDNSSSCFVGNNLTAMSRAMRFALRTLTKQT